MDYFVITTLAMNGVGKYIKSYTNWSNKLIPYAMFGMAVLKNLLIGLGALPDEASIAKVLHLDIFGGEMGYAMAAVFTGPVSTAGDFLVKALVDATVPVGLHSFVKNVRQFAVKKKPTAAAPATAKRSGGRRR